LQGNKIVIRSIRKGTVQWNEEDRQRLGAILLSCGYSVKIGRRPVPGQPPGRKSKAMEYIVEAWEDTDEEEELQTNES
jgi:hypothetical protein